MQWFKYATVAATVLLTSCLKHTDVIPLRTADAIVLLAGNHKERGPAVASLFHNGYANRVILTNDGVGGGWSIKYNRNLTVIEWAEDDLIALGVPRTCIVKLPFYRSGTAYDALAVLNFSRANGFKRLIVVTSGFHARRALWCFNRFSQNDSMEVTVFPAKNISRVSFVEPISEWAKFAWYTFKFDVLRIEPHLYEHWHYGHV